ncbi:MAG TPA: tRNA preQ1(34) S-adenosylmethionine ribosyltransferase-isomerase QueA [Chthonomonadaceae bacterium]|nr:tRNA preQ1(34) S-adenosylmethionine ribosyltransferase-isomerase QueA [Chthonomonadaceae bacterium]
MRTDLFDYTLPPERIAQTPTPRGESRLLVLHRADGRIAHRRFTDLPEYLRAGDTLVLNDTRVTARRLLARREGGQPAEALLLRPFGERGWEALVRPGRALKPGKSLEIFETEGGPAVKAQIVGTTAEGGRILEFADRATRDALADWGVAPLPPYIHTPLPRDQEARYQTVYAAQDGSAAAPTAGLHFTPELLARIEAQGVRIARLTLHVGIGTFRPVRSEEVEAHEMHAETVLLPAETAQSINATSGRVIAVGTTSVRALESAAVPEAEPGGSAPRLRVRPFCGETRLFITPGYRFRAVDALITNFHLPRSTLLMLVSAFAGREAVMHAYEEAIREEYRFFSFGDAMLIV